MAHPYNDNCPCAACTKYFNKVLLGVWIVAEATRIEARRRKEVNMTPTKPTKKKTLKSKTAKTNKTTK